MSFEKSEVGSTPSSVFVLQTTEAARRILLQWLEQCVRFWSSIFVLMLDFPILFRMLNVEVVFFKKFKNHFSCRNSFHFKITRRRLVVYIREDVAYLLELGQSLNPKFNFM